MAILANHPESDFPHPGLPCFRPDYLPVLSDMDYATAEAIEAIGRYPNDQHLWGRADYKGDGGIVLTSVPLVHRRTDADETWVITFQPAGLYAALFDSWDAAAEFHDLWLTAGANGAYLITVRHGYSLRQYLSGDPHWFRPSENQRVPYAVDVTTDQLPDDPGIRAWATQRTTPEPGICGLLAPELLHDALIGYPELSRATGETVGVMRTRVQRGLIPPTFPDTGALWTRWAAQGLVRPRDASTFNVYVRVKKDGVAHTETYASGVSHKDASTIISGLALRAKSHGIELRRMLTGFEPANWQDAQVEDGSVLKAWLSSTEGLGVDPPAFHWPDLAEFGANKDHASVKTRLPRRRRAKA